MSVALVASNRHKKYIESTKLEKELPQINVGDTLSIKIKILDGASERIATIHGLCMKHVNRDQLSFIIIRKIAEAGIAIETKVLLYSPLIVGITVTRRGKIRRADLGYLRNLKGAMKVKEKHDFNKKVTKNS